MDRHKPTQSRSSSNNSLYASRSKSRERDDNRRGARPSTSTAPSQAAASSNRGQPESRQDRERGRKQNLPLRSHRAFNARLTVRNERRSAFAKPNQDQPAEATLQGIPNELLDQIAGHLNVGSLCYLRQVCQSFTETCNMHLRERLTTLCIHPTRRPMKDLLEICDSQLYAGTITELCILGDPMWGEITKDFPDYRERSKYSFESGDTDWELHVGTRFKAWPWQYAPHESKVKLPKPMPSPERSDGKNTRKEKSTPYELSSRGPVTGAQASLDQTKFEKSYKLLIEALLKLPKLRTLSYRTSPLYPTLNATSREQIKSHAHAVATRPPPTRELRHIGHLITGPRSDAVVFYRLLATLGGRIKKVDLRSELPLHEGVRQELRLDASPTEGSLFDTATGNLKALDLTVNCGMGETSHTAMYGRLIKGASATLEELRLRLIPNPTQWDMRNLNHEIVDCMLRWDIELRCSVVLLSKLEHLEIIFVDNSSTETISRDTRSNRWHRPALIVSLGERFWHSYISTLKTLRFQNVIFCNMYQWNVKHRRPFTFVETMREDLMWLRRDRRKLNHFEWTVPAFRHHPYCKAADNVAPSTTDNRCEKWRCGIYIPKSQEPSSLLDLKALAAEFDVDLNPQTDTWNFGDYLREDIEERKRERSRV